MLFVEKRTNRGFCTMSTITPDAGFGPAEWDDFEGAAVTLKTYVYFGESECVTAESLVDFRRENGAVRFIPETISTVFLSSDDGRYMAPERAEEIAREYLPSGESLSQVVRDEVLDVCKELIPDAKEYFDFMDSLNF